MICPFCGSPNNRVVNSRVSGGGTQIRRRRHCMKCDQRFTTREVVEKRQILVVKRDDSREPFDREKIRRGLLLACRKRPVSAEVMEEITSHVERQVMIRPDPEVPAHALGELVLAALRDVDEVAYVRFASVYRQFQGIDEFRKELKGLGKR